MEGISRRRLLVRIYKLYDPPEFEAEKAVDAERFKAGQPNIHDRP